MIHSNCRAFPLVYRWRSRNEAPSNRAIKGSVESPGDVLECHNGVDDTRMTWTVLMEDTQDEDIISALEAGASVPRNNSVRLDETLPQTTSPR